MPEFDPIALFLIKNWVSMGDLPGLAFFTDKAIFEHCEIVFPKLQGLEGNSYTFCKKRQRLGLVQAKQPLVREVKRKDGKIVAMVG